MAGKFSLKQFSDINLGDPFFDSLKRDYPPGGLCTDFITWFNKKSEDGSKALVFDDAEGLGAFMYLKDEKQSIKLKEKELPISSRVKIGTLRLAERFRGQRLGEGAIGLALWYWQKSQAQEIYVTVFNKHDVLINQLERYGFFFVGHNYNNESVYLKSRIQLDYRDPYKSFPFINPNFNNAGYLIVDDVYHDTLFPFSELKNSLQEKIAISAANGLTKIYIGSPTSPLPYQVGEPILIYRKYTGSEGKPGYKSCITSYCIVTNIIVAKQNNQIHITLDDLLSKISNKSVFDENEIRKKYNREKTMTVVEILYYGYFGAGNNVNWAWLKNNGHWPEKYPTTARLSPEQFKIILKEGNVDVPNVIIN